MAEQISRELRQRGLAEQVEVEFTGPPAWVSVHVPRREANERAFIGDRRGQAVRLRFSSPVAGPIRLGRSSSFGLGLFRPVAPRARVTSVFLQLRRVASRGAEGRSRLGREPRCGLHLRNDARG